MQNQLFPAEIIENTTEAYLPKVTVKSQFIYISVMLALLVVFIALPFIKVDISVQSGGVIRTMAEKNEIKPLVSGTVSEVQVKENQTVKEGQSMYKLKTEILDSKIRLSEFQILEKQNLIHDLELLAKSDSGSVFKVQGLTSSLYGQQYNQFRFQLMENLQQQRKIKKELDVDRKLYEQKVIAMREFDEKEYAFNHLVSEYHSSIERQLAQWQGDLNSHKMALPELLAQKNQLLQEKELYTIKAPVSGTVQQLAGKYAGSYLQAGELLGIISPDSNLVVECYVKPNDIGFLKKGMNVKLQVDAFNYNEWGLAKGLITDVANDFVVINNQPIFKVKCLLETKELKLKSGYSGKIKKGMTIRARFVVTERTLYQLLFDKVDDWVNPKLTEVADNTKYVQ
ncbi:HlyD family secretion protein [Pseudarcicella hirudinis]|uniref:HlyD family secretion protein n=1 Tax=Pseudarcicella hirudinis TaxID=1079859 RepID=A0A1I5TPK5_9BACT|nr:HlyD family efflux transporter periplasmic adaptor subunit [Pseudarcicella hirudinis]SFP85034.1 HlyD family secretion protein [Pseudarcicella hirudinis]